MSSASSETSNNEIYQLQRHELIESTTDKYHVLEFLGSGSFGQVAKCWKRNSKELVALKILKNEQWFKEQGYREMEILSIINQEDVDKFGFVRAVEFFMHKSNICLSFEILDQSLDDFLLYNSLSAEHMSHILKQLLTGLLKLKELGVIHTDLKPKNIMVVDPTAPWCRVKIIDFGSARRTSEAVCNDYVQTRYYRSPEILLGLPYGEEIDMWSLGCIAAELFLRRPLYSGSHAYEQIRNICETQGLPPQQMLDDGSYSAKYFKIDMDNDMWILKSAKEYERKTGKRCYDDRKYVLNCLDDIAQVNISSRFKGADLRYEMSSRKIIVNLIEQMLQLDPNKRITPEEALNHPAIVELAPQD